MRKATNQTDSGEEASEASEAVAAAGGNNNNSARLISFATCAAAAGCRFNRRLKIRLKNCLKICLKKLSKMTLKKFMKLVVCTCILFKFELKRFFKQIFQHLLNRHPALVVLPPSPPFGEGKPSRRLQRKCFAFFPLSLPSSPPPRPSSVFPLPFLPGSPRISHERTHENKVAPLLERKSWHFLRSA